MESGLRLLTNTGQHDHGMRMSYPGNFPAEFLFRNTTIHPFSQVQFVPERIVDFSVNQEGLRHYKVHWQDTWVPEHQLLQNHHNIIEVFWQHHNPNGTNHQLGKAPADANQRNALPNSKLSKDVSKLTKLLSEDARKLQNCENTSTSTQSTNVNSDDPILNKVLSKDTYESTSTKTPQSELNKVLTQSYNPIAKKSAGVTIQCDEFDILNVKNNIASEEEIKNQAREVIGSFKKKRMTFPKGSSSKMPTECFFCLKIVPCRKALRKHQFAVHLKNIGEFQCTVCQQRFAFDSRLRDHMKVHSDVRSCVCDVCGLTCKRYAHLRKHMKTHKDESNFRCDVCHKNFKIQSDLKTHCLEAHKDEENTCNVCKRTIHGGNSAYLHSMRHSGTRDHLCELCGASFKSKWQLIGHQRYTKKCGGAGEQDISVNSLKLDYICTICDQAFAYKARLEAHMKTHVEETPEELDIRLRKKERKKAEHVSDESLARLNDQVEKVSNPETGEVRLKCKLCKERDYSVRTLTSMEKHLQEHRDGTFNKKREKERKRDRTRREKKIGDLECNKILKSEERLVNHKSNHEAGDENQPLKRETRKRKQQVPTKYSRTTGREGKRTAALNATSMLQIQTEEISSADDESEDVEDYEPSDEEDVEVEGV